MTAPMSRLVAARLTSIVPPLASIPRAMKTMLRVFATVHTKKAMSHQM